MKMKRMVGRRWRAVRRNKSAKRGQELPLLQRNWMTAVASLPSDVFTYLRRGMGCRDLGLKSYEEVGSQLDVEIVLDLAVLCVLDEKQGAKGNESRLSSDDRKESLNIWRLGFFSLSEKYFLILISRDYFQSNHRCHGLSTILNSIW
mmetsp:Transcript_15330/g.34386  ORF Transcript_15330/g.34386 Transcript_15330/m.34386 type:complete len:147 (-) Transcript_15330:806-1246(-)